MKVLKGIGAAEGKKLGKAMIVRTFHHESYLHERITEDAVASEKRQLSDHLETLKNEILSNGNKAKLAGKTTTADVLTAHHQILNDVELIGQMEHRLEQQLYSAKAATQSVFDEWIACFKQMEDAYLKERSHDLEDLKQQLLNKLCQIQTKPLDGLQESVVLVANDITPSMLASADTDKVVGIISEIGSKTSHTAILAANLGLPAVLGVQDATALIEDQALIFVDGANGMIQMALNAAEIDDCQMQIKSYQEEKKQLDQYKRLRTFTKDQFSIELSANVMSLEDAVIAVNEGAEGIGLFRTEFLFMDRQDAPSEEEQYNVYAKTAVTMASKPVIIRTMDIGGDKTVSYLGMEKEENPFLGLRALRLSFEREQIFMTQLRAILRASVHGKIKMMFPMVSSVEEFLKAKALVKTAMEDLLKRGEGFDSNIEIGVMIEIPSAAIIADQLIKHCDFFSIGTNDLTQYTLAVDRMNEKIEHLYNPVHPAMLRLIKHVADAAQNTDPHKFAGMCGEMAGNPQMAKLLIGLGLTELSMSPRKIPSVRAAISQFTLEEARTFAEKMLLLESSEEIKEALR